MSEKPEPVPDFSAIAGLRRTDFADLAAAHRDLTVEIKALEKKRSEIGTKLVTLTIKAGVRAAYVEGTGRITRVEGYSSRLDKEKLVKIGGKKALQWVEQATVQTPKTPYILITVPKEDGGEED